ncbi:MAG: caspase family protein [Cyanobacteria bacterium P01_D01_bin.56]
MTRNISVYDESKFYYESRYTNSRALIIGIDKYKNASPLSFAVSDAKGVGNVLVSSLGFEAENVTYLLNEEADKTSILKAFMRFSKGDIQRDERLFFFYAGHGHTVTGIRGEVGYLMPYDAEIEELSTLIRWDELTKNADLIPAKHVLFIMDACYGGLALSRNVRPGSVRFLKDMMRRYSRQVLTAGKANEVVRDSGGPLPNHSVFTGHLIEGLQGKAVSEEGVLTANGLMAYVYRKVSDDKDSYQTPHYGHFDSDGDFIFLAPELSSSEESGTTENDRLVRVPVPGREHSVDRTEKKIEVAKSLLSTDSSTIELHDFIINEVRSFVAVTDQDSFSTQGAFSKDELFRRISSYENLTYDLSLLVACIAYWGRANHKAILQKVINRISDCLTQANGFSLWLNLRYYPLILILYRAGIAAVESNNYEALAHILNTKCDVSSYDDEEQPFVKVVTKGIGELTRLDAFKKLPGHERQYAPMSEYLFALLQPGLDNTFFIGKSYEKLFDRFEILLALVATDFNNQQHGFAFGPIGRFGWKFKTLYSNRHSPFTDILQEVQTEGEQWLPLQAGLFGGSLERFNIAATELKKILENLNWY